MNPPCEVENCGAPTATTKVTMCRGHQEVVKGGRDKGSKRSKRRKLEEVRTCSKAECNNPAEAKGLCRSHYAKLKNPAKKKTCLGEECDVKTVNGYCSRHVKQMDKYGFTWGKTYPKERVEEWKNSKRADCNVYNCGEKVSSGGSNFCKKHRNDFSRKNCSEEFYVQIMSIEKCESCGEQGRLVVDHDHSCPHKADEMCEGCIRGRVCNGCNSSLGLLGEDINRILALADYLRRHTK